MCYSVLVRLDRHSPLIRHSSENSSALICVLSDFGQVCSLICTIRIQHTGGSVEFHYQWFTNVQTRLMPQFWSPPDLDVSIPSMVFQYALKSQTSLYYFIDNPDFCFSFFIPPDVQSIIFDSFLIKFQCYSQQSVFGFGYLMWYILLNAVFHDQVGFKALLHFIYSTLIIIIHLCHCFKNCCHVLFHCIPIGFAVQRDTRWLLSILQHVSIYFC